MPLFPISHDPADEYANVKPTASCTVQFDADENTSLTKANLEAAKKLVDDAMSHAMDITFARVAAFGEEFRALYAEDSK